MGLLNDWFLSVRMNIAVPYCFSKIQKGVKVLIKGQSGHVQYRYWEGQLYSQYWRGTAPVPVLGRDISSPSIRTTYTSSAPSSSHPHCLLEQFGPHPRSQPSALPGPASKSLFLAMRTRVKKMDQVQPPPQSGQEPGKIFLLSRNCYFPLFSYQILDSQLGYIGVGV